MPEGDNLLHTIETVYAAGLDDGAWPETLRSITKLFGATGATLEIFDKRSMTLEDIRTVGLPDGAEIPYVEYYSRHNSRAAYAMRNLSQKILFDYRFTEEREMDRDPYYTEYLASIGLRYFVTAQIIDTPDRHGVISVQRSRRQGHIERADATRMQRLLPHLRRAYDMAARLKGTATRADSLERALDWLTDGTALVRADGRVTYANEALQAMAREGLGIQIARGRLAFAATEGADRLARALASVCRLREGDDRAPSPTDFPVRRAGGRPHYLVSVRPLVRTSDGTRRRASAEAIVFVRDPLRHHPSTTRLMHEMFGLTDAEASVARALQRGVPLIQYAREQGLSRNTVYTHLRRIREKTHCKRQAELIRKLNDLQIGVRGY